MLVILEGADGTGKSTLARALVAELERRHPGDKVELWHAGPPRRHPADEYLRPLTGYRPGRGHHLVLDRWHIGERVYPRVRDRATLLDDALFWTIDRYLERLGAFTVYCTAPDDRVIPVLRERGDDDHIGELSAVRRLFGQALFDSQVPWQQYAWFTDTSGGAASIIDQAAVLAACYAPLNKFITYVGPRRPRVLLFGDVRHNYDRHPELIPAGHEYDPAFVPVRGTSGSYLLDVLIHYDVVELGGFGIANACDVDDVRSLWDELGRPSVVALGRRAQRVVRRVGVPHAEAPHPQYFRRFHHAHRAAYAKLLRDAVTTGEISRARV
jgi:hypothetical protein